MRLAARVLGYRCSRPIVVPWLDPTILTWLVHSLSQTLEALEHTLIHPRNQMTALREGVRATDLTCLQSLKRFNKIKNAPTLTNKQCALRAQRKNRALGTKK